MVMLVPVPLYESLLSQTALSEYANPPAVAPASVVMLMTSLCTGPEATVLEKDTVGGTVSRNHVAEVAADSPCQFPAVS